MRQMLNKMLNLVATRHDGQFDKSGMPYALHCLAVLNIGISYYGSSDEELLCILLGHDLLEDTNTTIAELRELGFSERVISGIVKLTKMPGQSLDEYKQLVLADWDTVRVKKCDITHNMDMRRLKGVRDKDLARITKYVLFYHELNEAEILFFGR